MSLVAVAHDEAAVRGASSRLLRLDGYQVIAYDSGEAFLASVTQRPPACALLEVNTPGVSDAQAQARLAAGGVAVPVIFITAGDDPAIERLALDAGGLQVLRKPFRSDAPPTAAERALRAPRC